MSSHNFSMSSHSDEVDPWADEDDSEEIIQVPAASGDVDTYRRIDSELLEYRKLNKIDMRLTNSTAEYNNPLDWWRFRATEFPRLSRMARKILAIPATSAPSERVFSVAGLTITKLRSRLRPDNASCLVFLKENWAIADSWEKEKKCGVNTDDDEVIILNISK